MNLIVIDTASSRAYNILIRNDTGPVPGVISLGFPGNFNQGTQTEQFCIYHGEIHELSDVVIV